jgi:hypothetical protein
MKHIYKVPMVWSMMGYLEVEAETKDEAAKIAVDSETSLPKGSYLDGSAEVDFESGIEIIGEPV